MIFIDEMKQPAPVREVPYTVTAHAIAPIQVQYGGVQGEHRATRLKFTLDPALESWFDKQLAAGKLYARVDVCDGSGVIHRSTPLELTGSFSEFSRIYYDLDRSVTRCGGLIKACLVFLLTDGDTIIQLIKSYHAALELDSSPTYLEDDEEQIVA